MSESMSPASSRTLGNILLAIAIVALLVRIAGMLEMIPKYGTAIMYYPAITALLLAANILRRRGRSSP